MSKYQRIYTQWILPDGDKITLSFRNEKGLKWFMNKHQDYKIVYKSFDHPDDIAIEAKNTNLHLYMKPRIKIKDVKPYELRSI